MTYSDVTQQLREAYAGSARQRDGFAKEPWKIAERDAFLQRLRDEQATRLLEVGAGAGHDSLFFKDAGFDVVTTDLTPEMVEICREKGLDAHVMDFVTLDFPNTSFDAIWALNCLLHVPNADLPAALTELRRVLRPGGLFFIGTYGGDEIEGIRENDWHDPPRFFSFRSDEKLHGFAREAGFDVIDFHVLPHNNFRFQALTLRDPI